MSRLKIIGLISGEPTEFDGKFVRAYDPSFVPLGGEYDGGLLLVSDDPDTALVFPDAGAAMECWRKSHGMRPDGQPNRPLTAFTVEVVA